MNRFTETHDHHLVERLMDLEIWESLEDELEVQDLADAGSLKKTHQTRISSLSLFIKGECLLLVEFNRHLDCDLSRSGF